MVLHVQVFASVPHVIASSLQVAVPLQSTVQVPEQVTANFSQPCLTAQRTTNSAVASTVIVQSFDASLWFISMRQFAFAAHVTALLAAWPGGSFTTSAQQLALLPGDCGQMLKFNFPLGDIHVAVAVNSPLKRSTVL